MPDADYYVVKCRKKGEQQFKTISMVKAHLPNKAFYTPSDYQHYEFQVTAVKNGKAIKRSNIAIGYIAGA